MWCQKWIFWLVLVIGQGWCQAYNRTVKKAVSKFSVEQLINTVFPHKISDDIDLDPCREDALMGGDIALPNIEYEKQWKDQQFNRNYLDAFEKYKKEILLEGLQIEEEGLMDVQRRKQDYTQQATVAEEKLAKDKGIKGIHARHRRRSRRAAARPRRARRAATAKLERVWDFGVIPYEIDANFSGEHKALFKQAMRHWENSTCLKFVERDIQEHPDYIVFTERPCGCCSFVGKRGNGPQAISLGTNCDKFGIVVHELGHVVGFWHEHTRPDRDNHVKIVRENIMRGQEYNFNKLTETEVNSLGLAYDYNSIMHYSRNTFSKGTYLDTIQPLVDSANKRLEIGQRIRLSEMDIAQTNLLYKCYKCGRTFQNNVGNISSPGYPSVIESQEGEQCEWRISATHGQKIVLNITAMDIVISDKCTTDYIEVRDGYWHKSPILGRFCGIGHNLSSIVSSGSRMIVTYITSSRQSGHRGFTADYEAVCGGDMYIVNNAGHLESPNYPEEYQNDNTCVWRLSVPDNLQIVLKFQSFELENHENCSNDYLEVRDGHSLDSPLIGRYCGFQMPDDIRSTGTQLLVKFRTDSTWPMRGFSAKILQESDECTRQTHGCEHKCINTLGDYECACDIGFELHSNGKSCENSCGGTFDSENGTITSPSFPEIYPPNKMCIWEIRAPKQHKVILNFTHMDLDGEYVMERYVCVYDAVVVHSIFEEEVEEEEDDDLHKHGSFCGPRIPSLIISEGDTLRVKFTSDNYIQKSGFAATFFIDLDECAVNNGGCENECRNTAGSYQCVCHDGFILDEDQHRCKVGDCRFEIDAPSRDVISPNYPMNYSSNLDCYWHFTTVPGHRIRLRFIDFDLEWHEQCEFDYITFHNGETSDSRTSGIFCGSMRPYPLTASGNQMILHLKSDASVERKGFRAVFSTVCGCRLQATNVTQYFFSHINYGVYDYGNLAYCDWIIEAQQGKFIRLTFETFELEDEPDCRFDFVEVYQYQFHSTGLSYGRYCGNNPIQLYSVSEGLMVRFYTDNSVVSKGFKAAFVAVEEEGDDLVGPTTPDEDLDYINGSSD